MYSVDLNKIVHNVHNVFGSDSVLGCKVIGRDRYHVTIYNRVVLVYSMEERHIMYSVCKLHRYSL